MRSMIIGAEKVRGFCVEYSVLVGPLKNHKGRCIGESYGVRIRMTTEHAEGDVVDWDAVPHDVKEIHDLTTRPFEILAFVEKMRRCQVTITTIEDVVLDCLPLSQFVDELVTTTA